MDIPSLRNILRPLVTGLNNFCTHETLPDTCQALGIPEPDLVGTKAERLASAFETITDTQLPVVAQCYLQRHPPDTCTRNTIEDILWADSPSPAVPKRFRHEVARALSPEDLYVNASKFDALLERLWILDSGALFDCFLTNTASSSLRAEIERHIHMNPGDWDVEHLFDQLGAFEASPHRFGLFIEGLASAEVCPDEAKQRRFVATVNEPLRSCGIELRESGNEDGYPVFSLVSTHTGHAGKPKNLIFASSVKPDIRFRDAVNNDIEIATHGDKVLVYDRPIGNDGLLWRDLQTWWSETNKITDSTEAKKTLYLRLRDSLPTNSPPQRCLFERYFRTFGNAVPDLPALLPEVWLHWDPKTVRERGANALLRFRMDFLMLLPHGIRVVIEVDGQHHYADSVGRADGRRYAEMVAADRELKLAGYEVFRFGARDLRGNDADQRIAEFFRSMFERYRVPLHGIPQ